MFEVLKYLLMGALIIAIVAWIGSNGPGSQTAVQGFKYLFERGIIAVIVVVVLIAVVLAIANKVFYHGYRTRPIWQQFAQANLFEWHAEHWTDGFEGRVTGTIDGHEFELRTGADRIWNFRKRARTHYIRMRLSPSELPSISVLVDVHRADKFVKSLKTLTPTLWVDPSGEIDVIETGDADFDARFNVYGADQEEIQEWLNERRRVAIQEAAEHEVFVFQGTIIWSFDKSPLNVEALDKALQPMRYLASRLE